MKHRFGSVFVPGPSIDLAVTEDLPVKECAVVGYLLGSAAGDCNRFDSAVASDPGVNEIRMAGNSGLMCDWIYSRIFREMRDAVKATYELPVWVILEIGALVHDEMMQLIELIKESRAYYLEKSIGLGS